MILGHAHPDVLAAVQEAAARGLHASAPPARTRCSLAEEIVARVEPVEQVRLVSSGTEATMSAIRLARGFTGRSKVVKFAGCYHGHVDALLASAGSGLATFALPDSAGVPASSAAETIVLPYNDVDGARGRLRRARRRRSPRVITEAAAGQHGRRPAAARASPRRCAGSPRAHGALLISDEVMTGFRCSAAGWYGLEGPYDDGRARPVHLRQGHGRRVPRRGVRRPGRRHGACSRPSARSTRPAPCRVTPSPPRPGWPRCSGCTPEVYARLGVVSDAIAGAASDGAGAPRASRTSSSGPAACSASSSATAQVRNYDDAQAQDVAGVRGVLPLAC